MNTEKIQRSHQERMAVVYVRAKPPIRLLRLHGRGPGGTARLHFGGRQEH
jgi:hypothetical protein